MRKCSRLQLAILHIYYVDMDLFLIWSDCGASEHFTQICANVSSGIPLRLCRGRPEDKVYSGTGMHNAREQRAVRVDVGLVLVFTVPSEGVTRPRGAVRIGDLSAKKTGAASCHIQIVPDYREGAAGSSATYHS